MNIGVIILAAGKSSRMGTSKPLLSWKTGTILENIIDSYVHPHIKQKIVVIGHEAELIKERVMRKDIEWVFNAAYAEGMSTSLIKGVNSLRSHIDAVLIGLADTPEIKNSTIELIIDKFEETKGDIIIPTYHGKNGHPTLFSRNIFPQLLLISKDQGARKVIRDNERLVHKLEVQDENINKDIDTFVEYLRRKKEINEEKM